VNQVVKASGRVVGIGLTWATLWAEWWAIVFLMITLVDPDTIDPGEGPLAVAPVLGSMGLLSGIAFGILLSIAGRGGKSIDLSVTREAGLGVLGSAVAQLAYLDHGDMGLVHNLKQALLFAAFGGIVTMAWLVIARRWSRRLFSRLACPSGSSSQSTLRESV
jgi:hypothetical protein